MGFMLQENKDLLYKDQGLLAMAIYLMSEKVKESSAW
jgi:hypothetical protein